MENLIEVYQKSTEEEEKIKLRNQIVESHLDFIKKQAAQYTFISNDVDDFFQEAVLGFIDALDRYRVGGHFLQCVRWGIRKRIMDNCKKQRRNNELWESMDVADLFYPKAYRRPLTIRNILKEKPNKELNKSLGVMVQDEVGEREEKRIYNLKIKRIFAGLKLLKEEDRQFINLRFGLNGAPQTFKELSVFFGKTPQRMEQIQRKVLKKLKYATARV